jgi:outer membrane receptor protein involved in Fe transport
VLNALLPAASAFAGQPVAGTVVDASSALPVGGARVRVRGTTAHTVSDQNGRFALPDVPEGTWTIEAVKAPYEPATDTLTVEPGVPPPPLDLLLIGEIESMSFTQVARREAPAPGGTEIVREEITHVPGARGDVLTAVQSLPGIANTGTLTPFSGGLIIRGSAPADSRVLVDGLEVPILYHFGAVQSILPSEMISGFVYAPGGFGVEQGRASSGIIAVNTRKGDSTFSGFAEISFINAGAFVQGPIGNPDHHATFAVAFRRSLIDVILPGVLPKDAGLDFTVLPRYYDYQARADWQPRDRWQLTLFFFGTDDGTELGSSKDNDVDPALTGRFKNDTKFDRLIASATYDGPRLHNRMLLTGQWAEFIFEAGADRHLRFRGPLFGGREEAKVKLGDRLTLRAGGEGYNITFSSDVNFPRPPHEGDPRMPSFTFDPPVVEKRDYNFWDIAAWTSLELALGEHVTLTGGGRYDGFTRNHAHMFQPRADAKVVLGANTVRAAGGLYTRPAEWLDEIAQDSLKPEKAWQTTLGVERELREGLTVQLTGFYTWRRDLIVYATSREDASTAQAAYVNRGSGRTYGTEALITWRGSKHFAWLAYTLSRSLRRDDPGDASQSERLFDFDQTHNLVLVASRRFGKDERWQLGGRFQLTTGKPFTPVERAVFASDLNYYRPVFGSINSARVELQHQLDVRLDRVWQYARWRLKGFIDIQNLYLHAATIDHQYSYDFSQDQAFKTIPILPSVGLRAEF